MELPESLQRLIREFSRLPGVGPKTAQRLAFHVLRSDRERADALASAIVELKERLGYCERCFNIAEESLCVICSSPRRDAAILCVVEAPLDLLAIERTQEFKGVYHVLHGVLSPIDGVGPDDLRIPALVERVRDGQVAEVIVATNPDIEGETTAMYLQRELSHLAVRVTRPAHGLPFGADIEYADQMTVARAMSGRSAI